MESQNKIIYFDQAATTSPKKEVVSLYNKCLEDVYFNPSSAHIKGMETARSLEQARLSILKSFGLKNHNVIFTSGASEANNLAIKGFAYKYSNRGKHIVSSVVEHPSVKQTLLSLKEDGFDVTFVPVNGNGVIDYEILEKSIRDDTILVTVMAVNNEVGAVNDIDKIVSIIKKHPKVKLHIDAVQGIGKINLPYNDIDLMTISMHKLGGLKGSGLLLKSNNIELVPLIDGGGQEFGIRSGTNDTPMAIVDSLVVKLALENIDKNKEIIKDLVAPIYDYLTANKDEFSISSTIDNPYILNFSSLRKKASVITEALSSYGICVATKSACSSKSNKASYVLEAMGKNDVISNNSIRLSFNLTNTKEEVAFFIETLDKVIKEIR